MSVDAQPHPTQNCVAGVKLGGIYYSSNGGSTWTQSNAPSVFWHNIAGTKDFTRLIAVQLDGVSYSTDMGKGCCTRVEGDSPRFFLERIDPHRPVAGIRGHPSTLSPLPSANTIGVTWTASAAPGGYQNRFMASCCSADASVCYLTQYWINGGGNTPGYLYKSTDGGANWNLIPGTNTNHWIGITCSDDGVYPA